MKQIFLVFLNQILEEIPQIKLPNGSFKLKGVENYGTDYLESLKREILTLPNYQNEYTTTEMARSLSLDLSYLTQFLYSRGASPLIWKRWAAFTAFAHYYQIGKVHYAFSFCFEYAILAGEWKFVDYLVKTYKIHLGLRNAFDNSVKNPKAFEKSKLHQNFLKLYVPWVLAGGHLFYTYNKADYDNASEDNEYNWVGLFMINFVNKNKESFSTLTESFIHSLAEYWMETNNCEDFLPVMAPLFETDIIATLILSRKNGFQPSKGDTPWGFDEDTLRYLEPGLVEEEPEPMFPKLIQVPLIELK